MGDISVHAEGGVADTVALLNHPRLNLLSRRPIPMQNPAGGVTADLTVRMPLDARVRFEQIAIGATATLSDVHLGAVAAGRDLDHGQLALKVDTDSLAITGSAQVGGIPAHLVLGMDFRDGPPAQVLEQVSAVGTASPAQAVAAGLPAGIMTGGAAGVSVRYVDRRDGTGQVDLAADLRDAAMTTPVGWAKSAGQDASASARLSLTHNSLTGIDHIQARGPDLLIASHVEALGGALRVLRLDQVRVGKTMAAGSITAPRVAGGKLQVALRGPRLDLSSFFKKRDEATAPEDDTKRGVPWGVDLQFDQVVLARDETLANVVLRANDDGLHVTDGVLTAGAGGQVRAAITPLTAAALAARQKKAALSAAAPGEVHPPAAGGAAVADPAVAPGSGRGAAAGRALSVDASEAGAVLLAAGVADNIRGGRLRLDAVYDDTVAHSPLSGTATLEHFG